jgi:hypothetical protein
MLAVPTQQCLLVFPLMSSENLPTQFAASLMRMAVERGYDFTASLRRAGLDFDPLDKSSPHWRPQITAMQYTRIYQQTLLLLQDETFGLHPGHVVMWSRRGHFV